VTGPQARAVTVKPRDRVSATLARRQHVEHLSLILVLMIIQTIAELHMYFAIGLVSALMIGSRDILIVLLFAEEEAFLK
jgi:hypothetical protein